MDGLVDEEALAAYSSARRRGTPRRRSPRPPRPRPRPRARRAGRCRQLEQERLPRGPNHDLVAGLGRADERDRLRAGAACDLVADGRARDHAEDAGGELRVDDALLELDRADGRARGRRPDHRVAARERGREQLGRHRVGPVPGRDHADDAAQDAVREHALGRVDRRWRPRARRPRPCAEYSSKLVDLAVGLGVQRLALVERERRELVAALDDQLGDALERRRALNGVRAAQSRQAAPAATAIARRASSRVPAGTLPIAPVARARRLEPLARLGLDPLAGDDDHGRSSRCSTQPLGERAAVDPLVRGHVDVARVPRRLRIVEKAMRASSGISSSPKPSSIMVGMPTSSVSRSTAATPARAASSGSSPAVSTPSACATRACRSGAAGALYSSTGPSTRAPSAPRAGGRGGRRRTNHRVRGAGALRPVTQPAEQRGVRQPSSPRHSTRRRRRRRPPPHQLDRLERDGVRERLVVRARVALDPVRERVHPGRGGDRSRRTGASSGSRSATCAAISGVPRT